MRPIFRTLTRCLVCGFAEVRTDEVIDRGVVLLAECPRCEHRWISRGPPIAGLAEAGAPVIRSPASASREVASAA
jgi:Zn-finger nucleic acid-binding protein